MSSPQGGASRPSGQPRFSTILADPPWDVNQRGQYGAERHYPLMAVSEICALPVKHLAEQNAHLWLWVTNATLFVGREVMQSWGFQYRSILTWVKPAFGLGSTLRTASEHLFFGTRGNAPILFRSQPTWAFRPRQEHSRKPDEQYAIIERCSPGPYLELFARRKRPGWAIWGNELESDVTL